MGVISFLSGTIGLMFVSLTHASFLTHQVLDFLAFGFSLVYFRV
jgi:hypothetical protein